MNIVMQKKSLELYFLVLAMMIVAGCKKENEDKSKYFPVIQSAELSEITYNSVISGGVISSDGGYEIISRGVCWDYFPDPTVEEFKTNDGAGIGSFVSKATGLSDETKYYLRAYATNVMGTGYGDAITFITKSSPCGKSAVLTDQRDGNSYLIIPIGNQCWMVSNLRYLPKVTPASTGHHSTEHYYVYGYQGFDVEEAKQSGHYQNYGVLYNWPAAINACPDGWHLPDDDEWTVLTEYLGGASIAGRKLKSTRVMPDPHPRWSTPEIDATNETGFSGLPGGFRTQNGRFYYLGFFANWWTSTDGPHGAAHNRYMLHYGKEIFPNYVIKTLGFNVRCIKDEQEPDD